MSFPAISNSLPIAPKDTDHQNVDPQSANDAASTSIQIPARVDLLALRRRIDWRLMPIMFLCYTMQFLDKININYAAVMGLNADLNLSGNNFSNASTAFFIAYFVAEVPNTYILQFVPSGKWLGVNVVAWGIVTACTAATTSYQTLLIARIFLGIFEAAISPCLMLIGSQWYSRSEQATRFSFWYCGLGFAQIIGGLLSFSLQHVDSGDLAGWRIMFMALGLVTVITGLTASIILPNSPVESNFLSVPEKVVLLDHLSCRSFAIESRKFELYHAKELLMDIQMWLLTFITILISVSSGVITTYSSTIIKQFGYTSQISALLNMPSGAVSLISTLIVGYGIRYNSNRWAWLIACCVPGIIGGGLMSFAPSDNRGALLTGIYLVNAITATLIVIYQWTMANVAGRTKRIMASTLIAGSFSVGNIIGPQTFQVKDAPDYRPAKIIVLVTQATAALLTVVLFVYYAWANSEKRRKQSESEADGWELNRHEIAWGNYTDKEMAEFRYVY